MFELRVAAFASGESMYLRVASCYRALQVCVRVIVVSARRVSFVFLRRPVQMRASLCAPIVMDARS